MRCLWRNKRQFYYALWQGKGEITDEDGNIVETGIPQYSEPVPMLANISVSEGKAFQESLSVEMFGIDIDYDKVIVTADMDCPIEESSVLWINRTPDEGQYDHIVTRISKSINSIAIAIKKVDVS